VTTFPPAAYPAYIDGLRQGVRLYRRQ
jgi:hypothetical protein